MIKVQTALVVSYAEHNIPFSDPHNIMSKTWALITLLYEQRREAIPAGHSSVVMRTVGGRNGLEYIHCSHNCEH